MKHAVVFAMCGLTVVDHLHFGDITSGITGEAVADMLAQVGDAVAHRFAASPAYISP